MGYMKEYFFKKIKSGIDFVDFNVDKCRFCKVLQTHTCHIVSVMSFIS